MKKCLVTGAGGFVGSNLVRRLLLDGNEVHVFLKQDVKNYWRLDGVIEDIKVHRVDITSQKDVFNAVKLIQPKHVYHLAHYGGNPRIETDSTQVRRVIVDGTAYLYEACRSLKESPTIVNTGSSSEYGEKQVPMQEDMLLEPKIEYGVAKVWATLYGELLRREEGMHITTLRLFSVYGPFETPSRFFPSIIHSLLDEEKPTISGVETSRDFVYVEDVVDALILSTHKPAGVYNVGTGKQVSLDEAFNLIKSKLGSSLSYTLAEKNAQSFDVSFWEADISRISEVFDWNPKTLYEGVEETIKWLKENKELYDNLRK